MSKTQQKALRKDVVQNGGLLNASGFDAAPTHSFAPPPLQLMAKSTAETSSGQGMERHEGGGPIQRHVTFGFGNTVVSDGKRPSSHLNIGALKAVISDLVNRGAYNPIEKMVLGLYHKQCGKSATQTAQYIKKNNWLSSNNSDVCHKVPYASMENMVIKVCNTVLGSGLDNDQTNKFKSFIEAVAPKEKSTALALMKANKTNIIGIANKLLLRLNASPDNLKFGYASSNRSLGPTYDFNYNMMGTTTHPEPPTPRGPQFADEIRNTEMAFGMRQTYQEVTGTESGNPWVMNSGVDGKKTEGTGMVYSKVTGFHKKKY